MATLTPLRIGPADHGRAMTLGEFREADEGFGYRYELARGVLEVSDVPEDPHGEVVCRIYGRFSLYWETHPTVIQRFGGAGEFRLWIPPLDSARNPDAAVVLKNAPADLRDRRVPALAVEVVSRGGEECDYVVKREEYLVYGLFEYWIVDPAERKVTVLVRDGGTWVERPAPGDQPIPSLVLPGFEGRPDDLWADA